MKKLKQIVNELKISKDIQNIDIDRLIRNFIFYSPKMPLRLHQEQLIAESKQFTLNVFDTYFTNTELLINCFSWGNGKQKVLLTHGWASKGLDFYELITELRKNEDLEIIAFDAPGNGSSLSEFSNLMLYADSIISIATNYAIPDIIIGHSLGCMANVIAMQNASMQPKLLISIAPLIKLKENFEQSMDLIDISSSDKDQFFKNFSDEFPVSADYFNLINLYEIDEKIGHFLAFDPDDHISPYAFLKEFLDKNSEITFKSYVDIGHYKILKSTELIEDLMKKINIK